MTGPYGTPPNSGNGDVNSPFGGDLNSPFAPQDPPRREDEVEERSPYEGVQYALETPSGPPAPPQMTPPPPGYGPPPPNAPMTGLPVSPGYGPPQAPYPAPGYAPPPQKSGGNAGWIVGGVAAGVVLLLVVVGVILVVTNSDDEGGGGGGGGGGSEEETGDYAYKDGYCDSFSPGDLEEGLTLDSNDDYSFDSDYVEEGTGTVSCYYTYDIDGSEYGGTAYLSLTAIIAADQTESDDNYDSQADIASGTETEISGDWDKGIAKIDDTYAAAVVIQDGLFVASISMSGYFDEMAYDEATAQERLTTLVEDVQSGLRA
ncbi:MAG: hypothetical protein ACRDXX_14055 [Stackebrandtia sp.]